MTRSPWGAVWFSPDNEKVIIGLRKGNLENNTNEYSLLLWRTKQVFRSTEPEVLLTMSSSSNRPAITDVTWLQDNETVAFLGEQPGEFNQVFKFNTRTHVLNQLTDQRINKVGYSITPDGSHFAYIAEQPITSIFDDQARRRGVIVSSQPLYDLIAGEKGGDGRYTASNQLYVGSSATGCRRMDTKQKLSVDVPPFLSPNGKYVIVRTFVADVPKVWLEYGDPLLQTWVSSKPPKGESTWLQRYELIDVFSGASRTLLDSPVRPGWGSEVAWSPDSDSVVISDTYLPLDDVPDKERELRRSRPFSVEIEIPDVKVAKVSNEDLRLLRWDTRTHDLVFINGRLNWNSESKVFFRKIGDRWDKVPEFSADTQHPEIIIQENLNSPPTLVAIDPATRNRALLFDLNPQFKDLRFGKVEEIHWKARDGHEVKGGIYYPVDYVPGKRYPLVIQTHVFIPGHFFIDGPYTTAFAAQPLASKGIMVLQMDEIEGHYDEATPNLMQEETAIIESAIDHLNKMGFIEPNRVGIIGFSITGADVAYALTHSIYRFAAASLTSAHNGGYFEYVALSNSSRSTGPFLEGINGGPPFGNGLQSWMERSPGFNADKIHTPLLVVALNRIDLLGEWELFSVLSRLHKPVEMVYMQDGEHVLERPWDRMISQQGTVDWFSFWLKGEEDPDPTKSEQYSRWRDLRKEEALDSEVWPTQNSRVGKDH
jgi:dipeptidyl aminopeptidase/acylaminoacyl peptidase